MKRSHTGQQSDFIYYLPVILRVILLVPPAITWKIPAFRTSTLGWVWVELIWTLGCYLLACCKNGLVEFPPVLSKNDLDLAWVLLRALDVWIAVAAGYCIYALQYTLFPFVARPLDLWMHWVPGVHSAANPSFLLQIDASCIGPIREELCYRGSLLFVYWLSEKYVRIRFLRWLAIAIAFVVSAIWFGCGHEHYSLHNRIIESLVGAMYGLFALCRRSIAQCAIAHAVTNSIAAVTNPLLPGQDIGF